MKKILFFITVFCASSVGQETEKILAEGKLLFRLEKASWHGTDDFLVRFPEKRDSIGGYLSYEDVDHSVINIFFSRNNPYRLLVRYTFDKLPQNNPVSIDTVNLSATELEKDLIEIRQDAMQKIQTNTDNFFTFYENSSLNLIPLIVDGEGKVFILTGPQVSDIVILGNDYLLKYDKNNRFVEKEKIHKSMLQFPYKSGTPGDTLTSTVHSHVITDCISTTDICTLLLYKDFVEWNQHYVISKKFVSIFDLKKEILVIIKRKVWEKMMKEKDGKS
jgi:hypothetical protein